mgnify:CR=1 FL=1
MLNAERILTTLDGKLDHAVSLAEAVLPDIPEMHDAFVRARPHILALAPG